MSIERTGRVLVVVETADDNADRISEELIAVAQRLSDELHVVVGGTNARLRATTFAARLGVSRVLYCEHDALTPFTVGPWMDLVSAAVASTDAEIVLIPATLAGRDIAPRLAARLDIPVASDVITIDRDASGSLVCRRQVQGGRLVSDISLSGPRSIVSVRPGSLREVPTLGGSAEQDELDFEPKDGGYGVEVVDSVDAEKVIDGIATAARIVSGGRGLGKPENFVLVEELANVLNAAVGASGAVVGAGWRPHSQQVGSTGTTVAPRLYLAVGISGAVQHTIGMSGSDTIVAINRDPDAPIFQIASLGVVGDLFEIVPALIEELKKQS